MTVALDITSDPFSGVMGPGRGGGDHRTALPQLQGALAFDQHIWSLRAERELATSERADALAAYLAGEYDADATRRAGAFRAENMLAFFATSRQDATDLITAAADEHVRTLLDSDTPPPAEPWQTGLDAITDALAGELADQMVAVRPAGGLLALVPGPPTEKLARAAKHNYRELNPSENPGADPLLLSRDQWTQVMRDTLATPRDQPLRTVLEAARKALGNLQA